jgi:hypothetical protein
MVQGIFVQRDRGKDCVAREFATRAQTREYGAVLWKGLCPRKSCQQGNAGIRRTKVLRACCGDYAARIELQGRQTEFL